MQHAPRLKLHGYLLMMRQTRKTLKVATCNSATTKLRPINQIHKLYLQNVIQLNQQREQYKYMYIDKICIHVCALKTDKLNSRTWDKGQFQTNYLPLINRRLQNTRTSLFELKSLLMQILLLFKNLFLCL